MTQPIFRLTGFDLAVFDLAVLGGAIFKLAAQELATLGLAVFRCRFLAEVFLNGILIKLVQLL